MKKLLYIALVAALAASFGCAITDYPIITDDRGDYSGIIRTAHKAYVTPSGQVATIYPDGSDELFTLVYQNQYGDQKLYTFNNFDPTGSVSFLDQTYCDWQFEDCELTRAWNPIQNDDVFDYEFFTDCSGARSLSLLLSVGSRIGECGSGIWADKQAAFAEFAELDVVTFQGNEYFSLPLNGRNTSITISSHMDGSVSNMPIYGQFQGYVDNSLRLALPVTPNAKYQMKWFANWIANHGPENEIALTFNGLQATFDVHGNAVAF